MQIYKYYRLRWIALASYCSLALSAVVLVLVGCMSSPVRHTYRKALQTEYGKQAGPSPQEQKWIDTNCPLGMPKHLAGVDFGNTRLVCREGYILEHSSRDKIPVWVCEHLTTAQVGGPLKRPKPEPFAADPKLDKSRRAELVDYRGSGYDRGHQSPSADQTVRQDLQNQTYFLSNMCPQWGALNQRIWARLEDRVRELTRSRGESLVITGPLFYEEAEDDPATADGYVEHAEIGDGVAVPTHFFKVVVWKDAGGQWQAAGFVMPNQRQAFPTPYRFEDYIRPISWIEKESGLNFIPELSGPDSQRIEGSKQPMWN